MKNLPRLVSLPLTAAIVLGTWSVGLGARGLYSTSADVRSRAAGDVVEVPLAGVSALRLGPGGSAESIDLGTLPDGVILAFDASCGVCNHNMWNWIDLIHQASDGGRVRAERIHALGVMPPAEAWEYWAGLNDRVQILIVDTAVVAERLAIPGPPATLVVKDGVVRHLYYGILDPRAKAAAAAAATGN